MLPGENLQRLIKVLERITNDAPNVNVESPKRLRDKDTGRLREHDVVLTFSFDHHTMMLALECRDRSRKVGVPDVEAFRNKCDRTGVHRGIIVSSTGFALTALTKATSLEIGCFGLEEVEKFNWCQAPGVELYERNLLPGPSWELKTAAAFDGPPQLYCDGKPLTVADFTNIAQACLAQRPPDVAKEEDNQAIIHPLLRTFVNSAASSFYVIDNYGNSIPLSEIVIHVNYQSVYSLAPFSFHHYLDYIKGDSIANFATARVDLTNLKGDLVMRREADGRVQIVFVPS